MTNNFFDDFNWDKIKVGQLGKFYGGATPPTTDENNFGGKIVWLVPSDLTKLSESNYIVYDSENKLTEKGYKSCSAKLLPINSLCISSRATIGEVVIAGVELCTNQGFINVVTNDQVDPLYLTYWIKNNKIYIERYAAGTTFLEIGRSTFKKLDIFLPKSIIEQQSIAGVISKVDKAIESVENTIISAEKLKKSLMQNLLTGKLKTDGTWRKEEEFFHDIKYGKYPKDWSFSHFIDFAVLQRGKDLTDNDVINGDYPVVKSNGIQIYHNSFFVKPPGVVTGRSGTIGKAFYLKEPFWAHNTTLYIKDFKGNNPKFIYYLILMMDFRKYYAGTTVPTLNRNDIHRLKVAIPKSPNEQAKIVDILDSLEEVLINKEDKKNSLKKLKKSLMQNLLTGKKRIDIEKINQLLKEA